MTEFNVVNLVALLIGLGFLVNGYHLVNRGREDIALFVISMVLGIGLVFVALFQDAFAVVAEILGLKLKGRAILVIGNLTLFVVVTYLFNRIARLYDQVSQLNEEVSLLKAELEDSDDD